MSTKWNKVKMAGAFILICMIAVMGKTNHVKAVEGLHLNQNYTIKMNDGETRLYQFTIPTAGNIKIQLKNVDPAGGQK